MDKKACLSRAAGGGKGRFSALLGGVAVATLICARAGAAEFQIGDVDFTVSGVATMGAEVRTAPRDPALIFAPNGRKMGVPATAVSGANQDDGNLNYGPGSIVSSPAKAFASVDARYKDYGVFVSAKTWGDFTQLYGDVPWGNYANGYAAGTPLGQAGFASRAQFAGFAVQQAYAYTKQTIEGVTMDGRLGEINVPWGLQTAIPGGLAYAVNAFDYAAVVRPGAQAQEALIPTPGAYTEFGFLHDKAHLDAFYLFQGPQSVLPGCGTFFSGADWVSPGCNNVYFNPLFADPTSYATDFALNKIGAPVAHDANFGFGGSYLADPLFTKFGLYYAHVDQPTPVGDGVKTLRAGPLYWLPTNPGGLNSGYTVAYLGAVDTFTLNFTTQIDHTSLYGEYTFSPNKPVNYNAADIVYALAGPQYPTPLRGVYNATPLGGIMPGYQRLDVGNLDLGVRQLLPPAMAQAVNASGLIVGAEFGLKQVYDMPSDVRFGRSEVFGQGPVAGYPCKGSPINPQQAATQCTMAGYVTPNAYGVRLNAGLEYNNVFVPGLKLTPSIGLIWDISGWSYDGIFNQGRVGLPLKIRADYGKNYFAEIVWTPALQVATYDNLADRQFVSFAAGIRF
jgi:Protein of unknown function (DUF1302)